MRSKFLAIGTTLLIAACTEAAGNSPLDLSGTGALQIVNAARTAGELQVYLDGTLLGGVSVATLATQNQVTGLHLLEVRRGNGTFGFTRNLDISDGETVTIVAWDSSGTLSGSLLADTNAIVPGTASKLRVSHFASTQQTVDIWRSQPDFPTPIRVQFPFPYRTTSPYLQSTPGNWAVYVTDTIPSATPNAPMPGTSLASTTTPISVPAGESRTVVVVDAAPPATGITLVVVNP